jgi:hypothetical protein
LAQAPFEHRKIVVEMQLKTRLQGLKPPILSDRNGTLRHASLAQGKLKAEVVPFPFVARTSFVPVPELAREWSDWDALKDARGEVLYAASSATQTEFSEIFSGKIQMDGRQVCWNR